MMLSSFQTISVRTTALSPMLPLRWKLRKLALAPLVEVPLWVRNPHSSLVLLILCGPRQCSQSWLSRSLPSANSTADTGFFFLVSTDLTELPSADSTADTDSSSWSLQSSQNYHQQIPPPTQILLSWSLQISQSYHQQILQPTQIFLFWSLQTSQSRLSRSLPSANFTADTDSSFWSL